MIIFTIKAAKAVGNMRWKLQSISSSCAAENEINSVGWDQMGSDGTPREKYLGMDSTMSLYAQMFWRQSVRYSSFGALRWINQETRAPHSLSSQSFSGQGELANTADHHLMRRWWWWWEGDCGAHNNYAWPPACDVWLWMAGGGDGLAPWQRQLILHVFLVHGLVKNNYF